MMARALSGPPPGMAEYPLDGRREPGRGGGDLAGGSIDGGFLNGGAVVRSGLGQSCDGLVEQAGECCDTPAQVIDLVQQQAGQSGVVVGEMAIGGFFQGAQAGPAFPLASPASSKTCQTGRQ